MLESVVIASVAVGAGLTPVVLHLIGTRATLVATGALLPLVALPLWHRIRRLDAPTLDPRRVALLLGNPIFAPLPNAVLERLAGLLEPVAIAPGEVLFREGDPGDRYFLIDDGRVRIEPAGQDVRILSPGDGFGEVALMRDVPRTATVRAEEPVRLYALRGDEFVSAVTGHATSRAAADAVIASRLLALRPSIASV